MARVEAIAEEKGATVAQVALAWLIGHGVVPIPGTRHRSRLDENADAVDVELTEDEGRRPADALPVDAIAGSRDGLSVPAGADR